MLLLAFPAVALTGADAWAQASAFGASGGMLAPMLRELSDRIDLLFANLPALVKRIPKLAETSIGHGLTADALEYGMAETVRRFRRACGQVV